jgi:hypothetical protein
VVPNLSHGKDSLDIAVIYTELFWLAEDGLLLGTIGMIDTPVSSAQPGRVDLAKLVDINRPGQDGLHLSAAITVRARLPPKLDRLVLWRTEIYAEGCADL